jgi:hypothetical protein
MKTQQDIADAYLALPNNVKEVYADLASSLATVQLMTNNERFGVPDWEAVELMLTNVRDYLLFHRQSS